MPKQSLGTLDSLVASNLTILKVDWGPKYASECLLDHLRVSETPLLHTSLTFGKEAMMAGFLTCLNMTVENSCKRVLSLDVVGQYVWMRASQPVDYYFTNTGLAKRCQLNDYLLELFWPFEIIICQHNPNSVSSYWIFPEVSTISHGLYQWMV